MAKCSECKTEFKFVDVLKATNPASVKCSGCENRCKSSYLILLPIFLVFVVLALGIWSAELANSASAGLIKIGGLVGLALAFEYGYFLALNKSLIKSNLDIS